MNRFLRWTRICALSILCLATAAACAQERRYTFEFGGGYTPPVGAIASRFNGGWNIGGGAGVNLTKMFSLSGHFMSNSFGVSPSLLAIAGTPGGDAHVWSITADPRIQLGVGRFAPYIVGGVGYYRETVNFTQPAVFPATFFDPFFGFLYPGLVPGSQVLQSIHHGGIGGSLGAGFQFPIGSSGMKIFTEARYHYADIGRTPVRMIPLTFGLRF